VEINGIIQERGPDLDFYNLEQKKLVGFCERKINPTYSYYSIMFYEIYEWTKVTNFS
jgi:hypothetical protein